MIIFLYGADTFRSRRWLKELKEKFIKDIDQNSYSLDVLNGATITLQNLNEKINTGSLFIKKRLVVVENIFQNKSQPLFIELIDYLKKIVNQPDKLLIFWEATINQSPRGLTAAAKKIFTFLKQLPYAQEFKILGSAQLLSFIKKEATKYKKHITAPAATLLISLTGPNLWLIAQEIKKLSFSDQSETIEIATIRAMTTGLYSEDIFALTDALSAKNKPLALKLFNEQLAAGLSDEYLLAMLIRQFKILLRLKIASTSNSTTANLATQLKLHPFIIKKGLSQALNFSENSLKNSLNFLMNLDLLNKTGRTDVKTELIMLISQL